MPVNEHERDRRCPEEAVTNSQIPLTAEGARLRKPLRLGPVL